MREPVQWEESDLLALITSQREEDAQLDFKRAESLEKTDKRKDEISKDVSAFANSAGGVILYGMEESPDPPHCAKNLSPVDPVKASKDWLEQVINSRIKPRIEGIVVHPIELKTKDAGSFAYVVSIPEGVTAYQASDKRYYKRFNFESVAMEDYEVRFVMNRASRPFYTLKLQSGAVNAQGGLTDFRFRCIVQNESQIVGRDLSAVILVPADLVRQPDDFRRSVDGLSYARIPATYVQSSQVWKSAVEAAHPYTPYMLDFQKSVGFQNSPLPAPRFTAICYVFDQFGLALEAWYYVMMQNLDIVPIRENSGPKRIAHSLIE